MACTNTAILGQLRNLVSQLEGSNGQAQQQMVCPPQTQPFAACCMVCPPPILAPTSPEPVKPLQLPCPQPTTYHEPQMTAEEAAESRHANFYNNYNIDYHTQSSGESYGDPYREIRETKSRGVTIDGSNPLCGEKRKQEIYTDKGCPTGFKPCSMKLTPPPGCHPCGVWCAQIQPCPPKPQNKVSRIDENIPCTRPNCKHWKSKDGECHYDGVCKADCFEPPPPRKRSI